MCGIVGCISKGKGNRSIDIGVEALTRLEYRGYDSAGIAFRDRCGEIVCQRAVGRISNLEKKLGQNGYSPADPVILHTRGLPTGRSVRPMPIHTGIVPEISLLSTMALLRITPL